jgi:hypothetical protein
VCRWQTGQLTDFTLRVLLHENPYLWHEDAQPELAPEVRQQQAQLAAPIAGQAIAVTAHAAAVAKSTEEEILAAARRRVDEIHGVEGYDNVVPA